MKKIFVLLCIFFYSTSALAQVRARVNALSVLENQPFQLELLGNSQMGKPDYSVLEKDFSIVGDSSAQSVSFVNGQMKSEQKIILSLLPKKTGILTIPSLSWGKQKTQALQIEVKPASDSIKIKEETALLIEAKPLTTKTYEGAGITYRVDVFERIGLFDGEFYPPKLENAQIIPLGDYRLSQQQKNGTLYQVLTQDYVIFPQNAGNFFIEPASFKAFYRTNEQNNLQTFAFLDPFIYHPTGRNELTVRAKKQQITVLPRPQNTQNQWWLPSSKVILSEKWGEQENIQVGQPITRNLELTAFNVLGSMLPDIQIQSSNEFKVYAENAQKTQVYEENTGLIGSEQQTFVFIPLKAGKLTLPSVSISWFDVNEGILKQAQVPSKVIYVKENPSLSKEKNDAVSSFPSQEIKKEPNVDAQLNTSSLFIKENNRLYFIGGLFVGLLIGFLGMIILYQKYAKKNKLPDLYPENK